MDPRPSSLAASGPPAGAAALVPLLACLAIAGCKGGDVLPSEELVVGDLTREFRRFVPTDPPDGPLPLLVAVHGGGGRDYAFPQADRFEQLAQEEGFLVVYPLSHPLDDNEGEWQLNTDADASHDIDFVEALIDHMDAEHGVDAARVYATGYSLGSMFTYELACHASDRFAAIASFAGTMPVAPTSCPRDEPVALMHIHGEQDEIIPYADPWDWKDWDAVGTMRDIPGLVQFWADEYACQDASESELGSSTLTVHDGCDGGVRVEHHALADGDHAWPDAIGDESMHDVLWSFVSAFTNP